jgi:protein O-mannosyl-transferase
LSVQGAWLGAALWALHPVQVESVAWITEMKNTESGLFFLLSVLFFVKWLRSRELDTGRGAVVWNYPLSVLFAGLAMASKSSTVILPVVLCLCAWYIEGRWNWRNVIKVLPVFLMSVVASALSVWTQGLQMVGVPHAHLARSWPERLATTGHAVWFYLGKLLWPHPLVAIYPHWEIDAGRQVSYLPLLTAIILILSLLWLLRSRSDDAAPRACLFAFSYFIIALLPVVGLVDNYVFYSSLVFDHFQYLASMGPLALAGAGLARIWDTLLSIQTPEPIKKRVRFEREISTEDRKEIVSGGSSGRPAMLVPNKESFRVLRGLLCKFFLVPSTQAANQLRVLASKNPWLRPALCTGLLMILGMASWARARVFESQETLWTDTLAMNPDCWIGHNNLGLILLKKERVDEAREHFLKAVELNPDSFLVHANLGNALFKEGELEEAVIQYQRATQINPKYFGIHYNLGVAFFRTGKLDQAITQFEETLRLKPDFGPAKVSLERATRSRK